MESKEPNSNINNNSRKDNDKRRKNGKGFVVLLVIIIATLGLASAAFLEPKNPDSQKSAAQDSNYLDALFTASSQDTTFPEEDYIARIYISGVIEEANRSYNHRWLIDLVEKLEKDEHNKGIILYLDSPGGSVYESDEAYLAFSHYQTTRKPIWAYMSHMACSGAYYIACGTQFICANRNTLTGSIGVISGQSIDITGLMNQLGVKSKTFTAGRNKNMLNFNNPVTEEQDQIMQTIADEYYDQFTTIVAINRHIDKERVKELADGRIYTAKQALNSKLIDKICSYDECVTAMKAKYQFTDIQVADFAYKGAGSLMDYLMFFETNANPAKSIEEKVIDMISPSMKYPAYIYQ